MADATNDTNDTPKKGKGRYTDAQIIEALRVARGMVYVAADRLGCEPKTIYRRMAASAKVKEVVEDSRGKLLDKAELALESAIGKEEAWAVCFALKTIGKHRGYVERIEQTGADGGPIEVKAQDYRAAIAPLAPTKGRSVGDRNASGED